MRPSPWQVWQGFSIVWPAPRQRGQVCAILKKPRVTATWPWPPQVAQVVTLLPGSAPEPEQVSQAWSLEISISFSTPRAASWKVMRMS